MLGGVVFTQAYRADIRTLKDLRGKDFMAVKKSPQGGAHGVAADGGRGDKPSKGL